MADTDMTSEAPSTLAVEGASCPSQITINIGGGRGGTSAPAAPDLSEYAKKADLSEYAKRSEIPAAPDLTEYARKDELPEILRLGVGDPVPQDTRRGTLIIRSEVPSGPAPAMQFPPLSEWSISNATQDADGYHLSGSGGQMTPKVDQMLPSDGQWEISLTYSWQGNFGEPDTEIYVYNGRTLTESGETRIDQGARLAEWRIAAGDHVTAKLLVTPKADAQATPTWAPQITAPGNGYTVHDVTVRRVA